MGDMADELSDQIWRSENPLIWHDEVDPTMLEQEEIQAKIEAYEQIDEDIKNQLKPF